MPYGPINQIGWTASFNPVNGVLMMTGNPTVDVSCLLLTLREE